MRASVLLGCVALGVSGCAAVVIPVAAGGAIGGGRLRHHRHHRHAAPGPAATAPSRPAQAAPPTVLPPPVPADRSTMTIGQAYRGDLPSPTGRVVPPRQAPAASPAVAPATGAGSAGATSWSDVLHFVAQAALHRPTLGVLPARGSSATAPRWVACEDKPEAVLIDVPGPGSAMLAASSAQTLSAMETMGVALVFLSQRPDDVARQRARLAALGLSVPLAGPRWVAGTAGDAPTYRATIAARYCVVAVVGATAAAFPNAVAPSTAGANPGWFLIR